MSDKPHKLQPAFFVALDRANQKVLWVVRGTHDVHDLLTDLCGASTPLPDGSGHAHFGIWRSTQWLLNTHLHR